MAQGPKQSFRQSEECPNAFRFNGRTLYTASPVSTPAQQFVAMAWAHDLTYMMSDDYRAEQNGRRETQELRDFAKRHFTPAETASLWNAVVNQRLTPDGATTFLMDESSAAQWMQARSSAY